MENKIYANTDNDTEFKTRLKVGEVVIVDYFNSRLSYRRKYVSVVKDITIDKDKHIYKCRLDNFNIDFELRNQVPWDKISAVYNKENTVSYVYKIEDYERQINSKLYYISLHTIYDIQKDYKVLIEAMKLQEKLRQ